MLLAVFLECDLDCGNFVLVKHRGGLDAFDKAETALVGAAGDDAQRAGAETQRLQGVAFVFHSMVQLRLDGLILVGALRVVVDTMQQHVRAWKHVEAFSIVFSNLVVSGEDEALVFELV